MTLNIPTQDSCAFEEKKRGSFERKFIRGLLVYHRISNTGMCAVQGFFTTHVNVFVWGQVGQEEKQNTHTLYFPNDMLLQLRV